MATKFYNVEKAAEILGVPAAEVNQLRETHKLRGLRDGADWKFKAEEVESLALKMKGTKNDAGSGIGSGIGADLIIDEDGEDVLLSDASPGGADPSASGTVIGPPPEADDFEIDPVDSAVTNFEDLDLSIEESGLELASSGIGLGSDIDLDTLGDAKDEPKGHEPTGASSILGLADDDLDDDDLVLGGESGIGSGSGSGSDITLGGDSGISLIDPADSGISLEEPLDLSSGSDSSGSDGGSLGLAGDSILSLAEDGSLAESSSDLSSEGDDFMLSSMDDEDGDDSSQVIALEEEGAGSGIGDSLLDLGSSSPDMAILDSQVGLDMGDDDEVVDLSEGLDSGSGIGTLDSGALGSGAIDFGDSAEGSFGSLDGESEAQAAPVQDFGAVTAAAGPAVAVSSEVEYGKWDYFFLYSSFFTLGIVGILMYDLVRNMWIWDHALGINSWLVEMFANLL